MKSTLPVVFFAILAAAPLGAATVAQSTGVGSLVQTSSKDELKAAQLEMAPGGDAIVSVTGTNLPSYSFRGRWEASGTDSVRLTINNAFGDAAASGTGTATIQQGRLALLSLNGATRGGRYALSYRGSTAPQPTPVPTPTPNANPRGFSLDQNLGSGGEVRGAKGSEKWERAHVILEKDGSAQITLRGPRTSTLKGTWKEISKDNYEVALQSGFGSDETRGTVTVSVRRSTLAYIGGNGTSPGMGGAFTLKSN